MRAPTSRACTTACPSSSSRAPKSCGSTPASRTPRRSRRCFVRFGQGALESFDVSSRVNSPEVDDPSVFDLADPPARKKPKRVHPEKEMQRSLWENGDDDAA